jgi:pyruvate dehydrogenase E1 component
MGATAGRTTLTGEGLQHTDGQSYFYAHAYPTCRAYDPAFAYELGVIVRDGIRRMYGPEPEDCFYYVALYNENMVQPPMPDGVEEGIVRGIYRLRAAPEERSHRAQLLASGTMVRIALEAQALLAEHHDVAADVWSVPGWKQLRDDALAAERWNRLHPLEAPRTPYVTDQLAGHDGPVVAVTDHIKGVPDGIARFVPQPLVVLGTDGYGFSDTRDALRRHFEVDPEHLVVATLDALAQQGEVKGEAVAEAITRYGIDADAPEPRCT